MQYNKIPIIIDHFNLFGIPTNQNTFILRKLDPFQLSRLQDTLVYPYGYTIMTKLGRFSSGDLVISL